MGPFELQMADFVSRVPTAELLAENEAGRLIRVAKVSLIPGWSKTEVAVVFLCTTGYPFAGPDCFWTDPDLCLANGSQPQATGLNPVPCWHEQLLWFSWHCQTWNPNRDTLLTWFKIIEQRLRIVA